MTPKPSEAELAQLELLEKAATPGPWRDNNGYRVHAPNPLHGGEEEVLFETKHNAFNGNDAELIAPMRNALPGLLARILDLEADARVWAFAVGDWTAKANFHRERAEAAGKRVEELLDARIADTAAITKAWGKVERLEAQLATAREATEAAVDFIATGDFTDDARRQAIAKAERALAGAEAGERRVFEGIVHEGHEPELTCDGWTASQGLDWVAGLEGKRVRLTVEVLPDPKEAT